MALMPCVGLPQGVVGAYPASGVRPRLMGSAEKF